jgi:hypothetical protein
MVLVGIPAVCCAGISSFLESMKWKQAAEIFDIVTYPVAMAFDWVIKLSDRVE